MQSATLAIITILLLLTSCHSLRPRFVTSVNNKSRRVVISTFGGFAAALSTNPPPAFATKGAAELDLEYYAKNLINDIKGERRSQYTGFSSKPLAGPNPSCRSDFALTDLAAFTITTFIEECEKIDSSFRENVQSFIDSKPRIREQFQSKCGAWESSTTSDILTDVTDQRAFDFILYACYKVAAATVKTSEKRIDLLDAVGVKILQRINLPSTTLASSSAPSPLTTLNAPLIKTLSILRDEKIIESFTIIDGTGKNQKDAFDAYDDEDFSTNR